MTEDRIMEFICLVVLPCIFVYFFAGPITALELHLMGMLQ